MRSNARSGARASAASGSPTIATDTALLTVPELAALLRLTEKGIYAMVAARRIPFVKVSNRVRFERAEVLRWLTESRVPASETDR